LVPKGRAISRTYLATLKNRRAKKEKPLRRFTFLLLWKAIREPSPQGNKIKSRLLKIPSI
jgi:hypothetical protein